VDDLLRIPLGLDVWGRHAEMLEVAATEAQLQEVERRRLAQVERLETVAEYEARWSAAQAEPGAGPSDARPPEERGSDGTHPEGDPD
jgi:hypothetical protein